MFKLTWPRAFVLVLLIAASVVAFLRARELGLKHEAAAQKRAASAPRAFRLPSNAAGATSLLGGAREAVRTRFGAPVEMLTNADHFDVGVSLRFFYEDDRATALIVSVERARFNEAALRKWLGIGPGAIQMVGGRRLRAGWLPQDGPDAFSVALEPDAPASQATAAEGVYGPRRRTDAQEVPRPDRSPPARGLVRLAGELIRAFPVVPDALRSRCSARRSGTVTELACAKGVDALVDYQLADDGTWSTLTILGPRGTDEKEACVGWLQRHLPDAVPVAQRQQNDELRVYFTRGPTRYLVSFLTLPRPGAGASCSLMACLEDGRGHATACRPG